MRESLKKSLADAHGPTRYPKGSIVLCNACARPIFRLDESIELGQRLGSAARKFKPLNITDLMTLASREDIDAGVRNAIGMMSMEDRQAHVDALHEMKSGDPMLCPCCGGCFVQVLAVTRHEVMDKSYAIEMLTIPPEGTGTPPPVRGRQIGANKEWVH